MANSTVLFGTAAVVLGANIFFLMVNTLVFEANTVLF